MSISSWEMLWPTSALPSRPGALPDGSDRSGEMPLRLALTTLCLYLDKHFKHDRESKLLTQTSVDQDMDNTEA